MRSLKDYGTRTFNRSFMESFIGIGDAEYNNRGEFSGFSSYRHPGMLNVGVWLTFVPLAYRDDVDYGAMYPIWDLFMGKKTSSTLIPEYVCSLQDWIMKNVEPTDELSLPRLVRFGNAFYDIGVLSIL